MISKLSRELRFKLIVIAEVPISTIKLLERSDCITESTVMGLSVPLTHLQGLFSSTPSDSSTGILENDTLRCTGPGWGKTGRTLLFEDALPEGNTQVSVRPQRCTLTHFSYAGASENFSHSNIAGFHVYYIIYIKG